MVQNGDFQRFSCHGALTLITKILQHTKQFIFCRSDKKKKGIILIRPHRAAVVVLAVVIFLTVQGKQCQCPRRNSQGLPVREILAACWLKAARGVAFAGSGVAQTHRSTRQLLWSLIFSVPHNSAICPAHLAS